MSVDYDRKEVVILDLLNAGWQADGESRTQTYKIVTSRSYPLVGGTVTLGGRPRFVSPNRLWRVTVGGRTTYFYRPEQGKDFYQWQGENFPTRERQKILAYAKKVGV